MLTTIASVNLHPLKDGHYCGMSKNDDVQSRRVDALRYYVSKFETKAEFGRKYGLEPSYISQLLGGHRGFGERSARNIEQKMGLPAGTLDKPTTYVSGLVSSANFVAEDGGDAYPAPSNVEPAAGPSGKRTAPVISWVQAGEWAEAHDPYPPGDGEDFEEVPDTAGANVFWLRVVGDSMTSPVGMSIPEGHLILVDPDQEPENGSLVVAKLTDSDEVTFKKLVIDAGQRYLKPLNPAYETVKINGNCRIVGVVREAKVKFF